MEVKPSGHHQQDLSHLLLVYLESGLLRRVISPLLYLGPLVQTQSVTRLLGVEFLGDPNLQKESLHPPTNQQTDHGPSIRLIKVMKAIVHSLLMVV